MSVARLYSTICKAASLDTAIANLTDAELVELAEYLSNMKPKGGIPAQVFGMVTARLNSMGKINEEAAP